MPADWTTVQGDSADQLTDTLTYSDGSPADLTGATLQFIARSPTETSPLTLTGPITSPDPKHGLIAYSPTAADTAKPGSYLAQWRITLADGNVKTWPTVGFNSWLIEQNLASAAQQLVSLPELKDYMASFGMGPDRAHDSKLLGYIQAATVVIENMVGPVVVRTFEEWHSGGQYFIQLRRRPSFAIGMNPVLSIVGCEEFRGPTKYSLSVVPDPAAAGLYSVMLDPRSGTLYRRTTGGGVVAFGAGSMGGGMPAGVHVVYEAGQQPVPANVSEAAMEVVRVNYQTTMSVGSGYETVADTLERQPMGPFIPARARELLAPGRRHPSIA